MPLLNNKPLQLHKYSKKLPDHHEVFYCEYTNEIFEDYEEYCQRVIACNSLKWTCSITGKTDLTYQEALASEQAALRTIKDFPLELRTPLLYVASIVRCGSFNELADKVFVFAKERYFCGETVEAYFGEEPGWVHGHVLQVLLPTDEEVAEYGKTKGGTRTVSKRPYPSSLYRYEIEELDDESDVTEVKVVPGDHVRRSRGVYNKEKNRIYLKQFAEMRNGLACIQKNILNKYSINTLKFDQLFVGDPPLFETPKKSISPFKPNSKYTQQSMRKFVVAKTSPDKGVWKSPPKIKEQTKRVLVSGKVQKKYQDSIDKVVQDSRKKADKLEQVKQKAKKQEEVKQKREQEKAEKAKLADFVKEWQRRREDLECEDLKELPAPCPVDCRLPNPLFGDFLMVLEFFTTFKKVINVKDYFPFGLKFEVLERALMEQEIAGPLSDILQLLLTTLFTLQEQEDDQMQSTGSYKLGLNVDEVGDLSTAEAVKLATAAASWTKQHYGVRLKDINLDAITVTEVLRLHLLSSGGRAGERSSKWRYQERGGYVSTDDPGLLFRIQEPQILRALSVKSIAEFSAEDKLKILTCLMNQILTYAEVRDIIDEGLDKVRIAKNELKAEQVLGGKKERELAAQRLKDKREAKEKGERVAVESEAEKLRLGKEAERKRKEFQKRAMDLRAAAMEFQVVPLGQDRAHRRFWIFTGIAGLFVEDDERWPGSCLPEPTSKQNLSVEEDTMMYVRKLFEGEKHAGSDKENEGDLSVPPSSPKKKLLGEANGVARSPSVVKSPSKEEPSCSSRLVCTARQDTCPIHGHMSGKTTWCFYYKETDLSELINSLNKRGFREHGLKKALTEEKERILASLAKCPVKQLNKLAPVLTETKVYSVKSTRSCKGYENANLSYPADMPIAMVVEHYVREIILDTEEKLFCGGLGSLKVKDRKAWRNEIENLRYDKQTDALSWPQYPIKKEKKEEKESSSASRPDTPCSVGSTDHDESDIISNKQEHVPDQNPVVHDLACAVLQIERAVEPKYLQKPLPFEEKKKEKLTALERWELSLMASTNFSQVYLHLDVLENSIQWNKSVLNARCKLCRRTKDAESMLLCDDCNRGFHLYCLKPKLTQIPKGDWFCPTCRPKEPLPKPPRSRRLFLEESDGEQDEPRRRSDRKNKGQNSAWSSDTEEITSSRSKGRRESLESNDEPLSKLAGRTSKRRQPSLDSGDEPLAKVAKTARRSLRAKVTEEAAASSTRTSRRSYDR